MSRLTRKERLSGRIRARVLSKARSAKEREAKEAKASFEKIAKWARERDTWGISMDNIEVEATIMARPEPGEGGTK